MDLGQIFAYINNHTIPRTVFNTKNTDFSSKSFVEEFGAELFHDAVDPIPPNYHIVGG